MLVGGSTVCVKCVNWSGFESKGNLTINEVPDEMIGICLAYLAGVTCSTPGSPVDLEGGPRRCFL